MKSIAKVQTDNRNINQLQQNIIQAIEDNIFVQGIVLKKVQLAVGSNTIPHKLPQALSGWWLVRQRSNASVYDLQDSNASDKTTLILVASQACTVDIFVF